jgi:hypothetical protein
LAAGDRRVLLEELLALLSRRLRPPVFVIENTQGGGSAASPQLKVGLILGLAGMGESLDQIVEGPLSQEQRVAGFADRPVSQRGVMRRRHCVHGLSTSIDQPWSVQRLWS